MAQIHRERISTLGKRCRHRVAAAPQTPDAAAEALAMTAVTIVEAAEQLGVHAGTVRAWISKGAPVFQRGKRGGGGNKTLVIPEDLRAWRHGGQQQPLPDLSHIAIEIGACLADIPSAHDYGAAVDAVITCMLALYLPQAALIAADGIRAAGLGSVRDSLAEAAWTAWRACDARYKRECAHALLRAWFRTLDYLSRHHGAPVEGAGEGYRFPDKIQRLNRAC